jgi:hypothetical protein
MTCRCYRVTQLSVLWSGLVLGQDKAAEPPEIRCRVTDSVHASGIAGAEVTFTATSGETEVAVTQAGGYVTVRPPQPGPWLATATQDAFVPIRYDGFYPFDGAQLVGLPKDDQPSRCELILKPRSALSGVIMDTEDSPVKDVTVTALWRTLQKGEPTFMFAAEAKSARDGSFLLPRLLPGVYVLRADPPHEGKAKPRFRTTYFPSVGDEYLASPIRLSVGTNGAGYRLRMEKAAFVDVIFHVTSSTVVAPDHEVFVKRGINDFSQISYSEDCCSRQKLVDGQLLLHSVPAGTYTFLVSAMVDRMEQEGRVTLPIGDHPETISDVVLTPLQEITAKLIRKQDTGKPKPTMTFILVPLRDITLGVHVGQSDTNDLVKFSKVRVGLYRLEVAGLTESQHLEVIVAGQPIPERGGINITFGPVPLEFRVLENAGSLEVLADPNRADACIDTSLFIFGEGAAPAVYARRAARYSCKFEAVGLPPGGYSIALVRPVVQGEEFDPALRSRLQDLLAIKIDPNQKLRTTLKVQTIDHEF